MFREKEDLNINQSIILEYQMLWIGVNMKWKKNFNKLKHRKIQTIDMQTRLDKMTDKHSELRNNQTDRQR